MQNDCISHNYNIFLFKAWYGYGLNLLVLDYARPQGALVATVQVQLMVTTAWVHCMMVHTHLATQ